MKNDEKKESGLPKNESLIVQTCRNINVHVVNTDIC